jgi:hypothetical protein
MSDRNSDVGRLGAEVSALRTEVKWLKWIIPSACGFVALLVLVFWNIERNAIGGRVQKALDEKGVSDAIQRITAYEETAKKSVESLIHAKNDWENNQVAQLKGLRIVDAAGKVRGEFSVAHTGAVYLKLADSNEVTRMNMIYYPDDGPLLKQYDDREKVTNQWP